MTGRTVLTAAVPLMFLALAPLRPIDAHAGLVGYWSFDGCTTTDASGNNAGLTAQGLPTCVPGRFGNAWALNGTDQYLDRASDPLFTPGARAWSCTAWAKTSSAPGLAIILSWYRCGANPACTSPDGALYSLGLMNGHPYANVRDDAATEMELQDIQSNLADGAWHFFAVTIQPTTDSLKLYVDGALRLTAHGSIGTLSSGSVSIPLEIGRWYRTGWGSPDYYFPGAIDEVRILDEELSAAAVAALFTGNTLVDVRPQAAGALTIEEPAPNPSRGGPLAIAFRLPSAAPATLAMIDVAGRLVAERSVGALGAGRHLVDLAAGRRFPAGVYLIRLTQGDHVGTRRVTLLH